MRALEQIIIACLIGLIRLYQAAVSSRLPRVCVFEPTCSAYAILALQAFGLVKGLKIARQRLQRCDGGEFRGLDLAPGMTITQAPLLEGPRRPLAAPIPYRELPIEVRRYIQPHAILEER